MTTSRGQHDMGGKPPDGSLAEMVAPSSSRRAGLSLEAAVKIAMLAALFAAMNFWQLQRLVRIWLHDVNWRHGFAIPLFSLYLLYSRREELLAAPRRTCLWGLAIMIAATFLIIAGFYPLGTPLISHLNMILLLFGLILYLAGPRVAVITWVPVFFLVFAMPIPDMIYTGIALPLQELAAKGSAAVLRLLGVQIRVTASHLELVSVSGKWHGLTVAEACSGVRSLMAFMALGVAWAYLEYRPVWQRLVLVASAVPIVVLCNVLRVTITCSMYVVDKPELGMDFMHEFVGLLMLIPAAGMLWVLSRLLKSLFVEVDEEEAQGPRAGAAEGPAA